MAKQKRQHIWYDELKSKYPKLRKALGVTKRSFEETDILVFKFGGRIFIESHDEYSLSEWKDDELIDLDWNKDRPPV